MFARSDCPVTIFSITVTGNNPQPQSFSFTGSGSQLVTLDPGSFEITESTPPSLFLQFNAFVSGDCTGIIQTYSHQAQATETNKKSMEWTCTNIHS